MLKNTSSRYGLVAKTLHWSAALLIVAVAVIGLIMADMPRSPEKNDIVRLHASLGMLLAMLMTARLAWRFLSLSPSPSGGTPRWRARLAGLAHWGLYLLVYAQVATGAMSLFTVAWNIPFFGFFEVPTPYAERDMEAHHLWEGRHTLLFWSLAALVALHAGAALHHHFFRRDETLKRMTLG